MGWTAEQKRQKRAVDAEEEGRVFRPKVRRRGSVPEPVPEPPAPEQTRTLEEENEALRMENEDLRQRLMGVTERISRVQLAAYRRQLRAGDKVRIRAEFAKPLGLSEQEARFSYQLVKNDKMGRWELNVLTGASKGKTLWANVPEAALDY